MKELWVKKSVYRRYLIKDEDIKEVNHKNIPKFLS